MTKQQHPITPTPALVRKWARFQNGQDPEALWLKIGTLAAQWGADQELEACITWLDKYGLGWNGLDRLRIARRPKPPSLKEQALEQLGCIQADLNKFGMGISTDTIRTALEALDD
jgi:hypothetical protein